MPATSTLPMIRGQPNVVGPKPVLMLRELNNYVSQ
jgi:hypothetical protein